MSDNSLIKAALKDILKSPYLGSLQFKPKKIFFLISASSNNSQMIGVSSIKQS